MLDCAGGRKGRVVAVSGSMVGAFLITGLLAGLAYALKMISRSGALGGFVVGAVIYLCLGPPGFVVLALFVVGGSALTRLGYRSKHRRGVAQDHGGRRGARNALAKDAGIEGRSTMNKAQLIRAIRRH